MVVAVSAAVTFGLVAPSASADQISNLQAEAAAINARITSLGNQEEALSEQYDGAVQHLQDLQGQVSQAQSKLATATATATAARNALRQDAIQAYVDGGSNPLAAGNSPTVASATSSLLRAEYVNTLVTAQSDAIDRYHTASLQEQAAEADLKQQAGAAAAQVKKIDADRSALVASSNQLTGLYHQVTGQLAQAVAAQQAAQQRAAQAAAQARAQQQAAALAAEAAAQQAARTETVGTSTRGGGAQAPSANFTPPPPGSGAAGAVAAAESRLGDWYQWGAAGPSTFDCSGLVMWAYAQVGISLPHFSGAQYADTTHIPMSDLQPGDLVFFANPGEHVAMYVGNGEVIEAPHTGAQVHIVPMYSGFVLASRVA